MYFMLLVLRVVDASEADRHGMMRKVGEVDDSRRP